MRHVGAESSQILKVHRVHDARTGTTHDTAIGRSRLKLGLLLAQTLKQGLAGCNELDIRLTLELADVALWRILSEFVQSQIMGSQVGATKEGLSTAKAGALLVPIPPLAEQRRIVAQLDALLANIA